MNTDKIHGLWWVPDGHRRFSNEKRNGVLFLNQNSKPELELYFYPNIQGCTKTYEQYDIIWGQDVFERKYTLFNSLCINNREWTIYKYIPSYVLLGEHLNSFDMECYDCCNVKFNYLRNWVKPDKFTVQTNSTNKVITIGKSNTQPLLKVILDDNIEISINWFCTCFSDHYTIKAEQDVYLSIKSLNKLSLSKHVELITIFSQFLSIALFKEQFPSNIVLYNSNAPDIRHELQFEFKESKDPSMHSLIDFKALQDRLPSIIQTWYRNYNNLFHISRYLIKSIGQSQIFDAPDFLIIAQALDGYFKRFKNKTNGKDIRKFQVQIDILLDYFKNIEAVKECNINSLVLTHSRNKFTHLIPDDENSIKYATDGFNLYWLTQKCIILLTCCVLDCIGFSLKEINDCCSNNVIRVIVDSLPKIDR